MCRDVNPDFSMDQLCYSEIIGNFNYTISSHSLCVVESGSNCLQNVGNHDT